jgi:acyl-CoA synthetase (AMP-forming)/AMP-acid ligase II
MSIFFERVKKNSNKFPAKVAVVAEDRSITYSELVSSAEVMADSLKNIVSSNGLRIAICINEDIDLPVLVLALNLLGATIIPLNPGLLINQIEHLLHSVDANTVIVHKDKISAFIGLKSVKSVIGLENLYKSSPMWVDIDQKTTTDAINYAPNPEQFLITLSSGSTGNPKPIIISEENKWARFEQAARSYQVTECDTVLCASPFYHSLGQRLTFLPLLAGGTLCILKAFTAKNWVNALIKNKVTLTIPVSSHLHEVIDSLLEKPFRFPALRCLVSSSAAINDEVKYRLFEELPCEFHEMYGASEIATATNLSKEQAKLKPNSVGFPNPGVEIRIVDEQIRDCLPNIAGQILVKSPLMSSGYYGLPLISAESYKEGFFLTGDIGYLDGDGFLYFVDRKKDIIISGGINIYPSDIEGVLNESQEVKESYALGIYDEFLGEVPVAVIITDAEYGDLEKILRTKARNKLAAYQRPFKYFFKDKVPLTASGKVDKRALRDELNLLKLNLSSKLLAMQNMQGSK